MKSPTSPAVVVRPFLFCDVFFIFPKEALGEWRNWPQFFPLFVSAVFRLKCWRFYGGRGGKYPLRCFHWCTDISEILRLLSQNSGVTKARLNEGSFVRCLVDCCCKVRFGRVMVVVFRSGG